MFFHVADNRTHKALQLVNSGASNGSTKMYFIQLFSFLLSVFIVFIPKIYINANKSTIPIYFKTSLTASLKAEWRGKHWKKANQQEISRTHCIMAQVFALILSAISGVVASNLNLTTAHWTVQQTVCWMDRVSTNSAIVVRCRNLYMISVC